MATRGRGQWLGLGAAAGLGYMAWRAARRGREADLRGQVALVAGGSRGLGLLLARELLREGCRVAICARDPRELERARDELARSGGEVMALVCDVADEARVGEVVEEVAERWGAVDLLVNVAATMEVGPVQSMTRRDFERAMEINFWGPYNTTMAVLPAMRARGRGRIVNITSIGGKVSLPHMLPYNCSKFAFVGLSEGLRAELAGDGVVVTTIVPGLMRTGSQVNALYAGDAEAEFSWFTVVGANPLLSVSAESAARRIVRAARRGEAEVMISWPAQLGVRAHGVLPGLVTDTLALVNRMLPAAPKGDMPLQRGMQIATPVAPSLLTTPMNRAARRFNEYGGEESPSPEHARRVGLEAPDEPPG